MFTDMRLKHVVRIPSPAPVMFPKDRVPDVVEHVATFLYSSMAKLVKVPTASAPAVGYEKGNNFASTLSSDY